MAALVQSLPTSSSSTMTMLQARTSSSDHYQSSPSNHSQRALHHPLQQSPQHLNSHTIYAPSIGLGGYRAPVPVTPFIFQSAPIEHPSSSHPRQLNSPQNHYHFNPAATSAQSSHDRPPLVSSASANSSPTKLPSNSAKTFTMPESNASSSPSLSYASVAKAAPDRYRRNSRRIDMSNNPPATASTIRTVHSVHPTAPAATHTPFYSLPVQSNSSPTLTAQIKPRTQSPQQSSVRQGVPYSSHKTTPHLRQTSRESVTKDNVQKLNSIASVSSTAPQSDASAVRPKSYAAMLASPAPSTPASRPLIERKPVPSNNKLLNPLPIPAESSCVDKIVPDRVIAMSQPLPKASHESDVTTPIPAIHIPPRGSSDTATRIDSQRQPDQSAFDKPLSPEHLPGSAVLSESPAAQQLAALNMKDGKRSYAKSSRLRRAFSFGSAAELRKASAEHDIHKNKLQKPQYETEEEAQQAAIAQQQEASGLGASIYSGQGHFFSGSTDNLSISSTASSASIMIRKMGKGMKRGSRSLAGLFRPKSIIGPPDHDASTVEASTPQVSMVTIEAEREKVNVNLNPHDHVGGGTGFPKLERNSLDTSNNAQLDAMSEGRGHISGGDRERMEVLAAVRKGILKRPDSENSSPVVRPATDYVLPIIPRLYGSPASSAPSTPGEDVGSRSKAETAQDLSNEYFSQFDTSSIGQTSSVPGTPKALGAIRPAMPSRNISFSPRIQFHDTWPSQEYDRRGEVATCNRLTPMLAQQIKEELNSFKMEMEVHAASKVYTHFF